MKPDVRQEKQMMLNSSLRILWSIGGGLFLGFFIQVLFLALGGLIPVPVLNVVCAPGFYLGTIGQSLSLPGFDGYFRYFYGVLIQGALCGLVFGIIWNWCVARRGKKTGK